MEASVLEQPIALKTCYKCKMELPTGMFWKDKGRKDGLQPCCKACCALYREPHKEQKAARAKLYREDHKEQKAANGKIYRESHKEQRAAYYEANKEQRAAKQKQRRLTDPRFKLSVNLRCRLHDALKGNYKAGSAVRDCGCSMEALRLYLESKFQPGMTWANWGINGWHIDHIRPLSSFDLTDREQFLKACHYTNLQPLWAKDNLSKGDRLDWQPNA
jgi:hypothetical protein